MAAICCGLVLSPVLTASPGQPQGVNIFYHPHLIDEEIKKVGGDMPYPRWC